MSLKKTLRVLTLSEKYQVWKSISSGKKQTEAAELFDPPLPILKNRKKIVSAYGEGVYKDKCKKMKDLSYPDLDKVLALWLYKVTGLNVAVNGIFLLKMLSFPPRNFATQTSRQVADIWKSLNWGMV